jgi:hypothetical protein
VPPPCRQGHHREGHSAHPLDNFCVWPPALPRSRPYRGSRGRKAIRGNIISKLNAAVADALADTNVRSRLTELAQKIPLRDQQTPDALRAFHKTEIEKWWPIIEAAGIKPE